MQPLDISSNGEEYTSSQPCDTRIDTRVELHNFYWHDYTSGALSDASDKLRGGIIAGGIKAKAHSSDLMSDLSVA
jgi:hypothetical protein